MGHRVRLLAISFAASSLLFATSARAQTGQSSGDQGTQDQAGQDQDASSQGSQADAEARMHFRVGQAYYNGGKFEQAAIEFQRSYDLSHRPALLYNLFVALRDAGHLHEAITALRLYLSHLPVPTDRASVEQELEHMEHVYAAQQREHGHATTAPASASSPPSSGPGAGPWIVMAGGGALLAGSVITGIVALNAQSDLESMCDANRGCPPSLADTPSRGHTFAIVSDVLMVGGAVAVAGGLLWLVLGGHGSEESSSSAVSFACVPGGCAGAARLTF